MSIYKRKKPKTSVKHPLNSIVAFRETIVLEIKDQPRRKRFLNPHPLFVSFVKAAIEYHKEKRTQNK